MLWVLLLLVIAIVLLSLLNGLRGKLPGGRNDDYPYTQQRALFTPTERAFLGVLDQAVGEQYRIFGKVRVADVIEPRKGLDKGKRQTAFNKIQSKHFDFLLCAKNDLSILCAIELDDKSHKQRKRQERDRFLGNACRAAGVPLLQIPAQHGYTVHDLRTRIYDSLESVTLKSSEHQPKASAKGPTVVGFPRDPDFGLAANSSASDPSVSEPQFGSILGISAAASTDKPSQPELSPKPGAPKTDKDSERQKSRSAAAPTCPKCGSPMVRRRVKSGSRAGLVFWGCSTYPKCRGAVREGSRKSATQTPSSMAGIDN
jgi:ribosomal protein L37AE/L43A